MNTFYSQWDLNLQSSEKIQISGVQLQVQRMWLWKQVKLDLVDVYMGCVLLFATIPSGG